MPPGTAFRSHGFLTGAEVRVLVRRAHREFVHIGLAERDHAGSVEALDDGRVERARVIFEHLGTGRRAQSRVTNTSLCAIGMPVSGAGVALRDERVGGFRLRERELCVDADERVQILRRLDALEIRLRELDAEISFAASAAGSSVKLFRCIAFPMGAARAARGALVHSERR